MRQASATAVLLGVACSGGDEPFADPASPTALECAAIEARWDDVIASLDRSCATAADCVVIEGGSCEGGQPSLGSCLGTALNAAAYQAARSRLDEATHGWASCTCARSSARSTASPTTRSVDHLSSGDPAMLVKSTP